MSGCTFSFLRRAMVACLVVLSFFAADAFAAGDFGLYQKKYTGKGVTTGDPSDGGDVVSGALFASVDRVTTPPSTCVDGGVTYTLERSTTAAYRGGMLMQGGLTYYFAKNYTDFGQVIVIDHSVSPSTNRVIISDSTWNNKTYSSFTPKYSGWYGLDLRVAPGTGNIGPNDNPFRGNLKAGLAWNTNGLNSCTTANYTKWNRFMNGETAGDYLYTDNPGVALFENGGTVSCGSSSISLTTQMTDGKGDLTFEVSDISGNKKTLELGHAEASTADIVAKLTGFSSGKVYSLALLSYSEELGITSGTSFGNVYFGNISVAKVSDADAGVMTAGSFKISRPSDAEATSIPLTVYFTLSGATAGTHFEEVPLYATIPAGESEVTVSIVPIWTGVNDQALTLKLTSGLNYLVGTSSASLTIKGSKTSTLTRFVDDSKGSDSYDGLTETTAFKTLQRALDDIKTLENTTIKVAPGTYTTPNATLSAVETTTKKDGDGVIRGLWFSNYQVTNSVKIVGTGSSPDDVVFKWTACQNPNPYSFDNGGTYTTQPAPRLFYINNAGAKLKNLTVTGGRAGVPNGPARRDECGGSNVFIDTAGGTLEDCVISDGLMGTWGVGGGNIRMYGGRISRCKITKGVRSGYTPTSDGIGGAIYMTGGYVENSLFYDNGDTGSSGTIRMSGSSVLANCTIAGNHGNQCAGVVIRGTSCKVYNCAIFGNDVQSELGGISSAYYLGGDNATVAQFSSCAADREINSTCIVSDEGGFVNESQQDYHLGASSVCRDQANSAYYVEPQVTSKTDLDGIIDRMSGAQRGKALDIGCYEFDNTKLAVDFYADNTIGLMEESGGSLQPVAITFHIVKSGGEGTCRYSWDFDGDGTIDLADSTDIDVSWAYAKMGTYTVKLYATDDTGDASAQKDNYIATAPHVLYVNVASANPVSPYITRDTAALNVRDAYGWAAENGSTILVTPGVYPLKKTANAKLNVVKGVKIICEGATAADTVFTNDVITTGRGLATFFRLMNSNSLLANATFAECRHNWDNADNSGGAGVTIEAGGGIVSNCVFKHCGACRPGAQAGGAVVNGGLLTHCIIDDCFMTWFLTTNAVNGAVTESVNDIRAQGVYISGNGKVENCLLKNMHSDGDIVCMVDANASMRNCTIIDCSTTYWADNNARNATGTISCSDPCPRRRNQAAAIDLKEGSYGSVYNTAVFNVGRREFDMYLATDSTHWVTNTIPATNCATRVCTGPWGGISSKDISAYFYNCATDDPSPINSTCLTLTKKDFVDYDNQDFTPQVDFVLYNSAITISGWDEITDLAGKSRYVGKGMDIGCYEQQYGGIVYTNLYVDCLSGDDGNPGTMAEPKKTIANACAEAKIAGGCVFVRGGPDRTYTFSSSADSAVLTPGRLSLVGCDANWNPATDYADADAMATIVIADDYAASSYTAAGGTTWNAPIVAHGANGTVSGIRFTFGGQSFKQQAKGGGGLIEAQGSGLTVENCYFKMSVDDTGLGYYGGACSAGLINAPSGSAGLKLRNCYVWLGKYRASLSVFQGFGNGTTVEQCLFENIDTLYGHDTSDLAVNKQACYNIVSNVFLNCDNGSSDIGYETQLLGVGSLYCPAGGEIAYNRFIHNDGKSGHYVLMQHGSDASDNGTWSHKDYETLIHHNTIVGYDIAFEAPFFNNGKDNNGSMWKPFIFDNLVIASYAISEEATDQWVLNSTKYNASFKKNSKFWNNALLKTEFATGSATAFSWWDYTLIGEQDTTTLDAVPSFVDTANPRGENYYRLKIPSSPWVVNAYVGEYPDTPDYPKYIGAVEPQPGGFAVRIR